MEKLTPQVFLESVMTRTRVGKLEVRVLESMGEYVIYNYADPESGVTMEKGKRKICLRDDAGKVQEFFMIPVKGQGRYLTLLDKGEENERKIWNQRENREEKLWLD